MRKLKLQLQTTLDGFIAGPNNEMDWMNFNWDEGIKNYVKALTSPCDTILLGRVLAQGFIPHWAANPEYEEKAAVDFMNNTPKVVFTKTLKSSDWKNTELATGNLVEKVNELKNKKGGDIIAYGGATFAASLIREGLIDEFFLFVNPAAIGKGKTIFQELSKTQKLKLIGAVPFECGIVAMNYQRI